jgi:hypothetical protein
MVGKPCDRCGAVDKVKMPFPEQEEWQIDIDQGYEEVEKPPAMCGEVHISFGLVSWLCHDCRKEYHRFAKDHSLNIPYGDASLRLEFWKNRVGPETDPTAIEEGIELWRVVDGLERQINLSANEWLVSSPDDLRMH